MTRRTLHAAVVILLLGSAFAAIAVRPTRASSMFEVLNTSWGSTSTALEVGPGDQNVPLTVNVKYFGSATIVFLRGNLNLPVGLTNADGKSDAFTYSSASISPFAVFQLVFYLDIGSKAELADYAIPLTIEWDISTIAGLMEIEEVSVSLKGKVKLVWEPLQTSLNPGQVNNLTLRLRNDGSGSASQLSLAVTAPAQVSLLSYPTEIPALESGTERTLLVSVYASPSSQGSPISLTLATTYIDAYGCSRLSTKTLGFNIKDAESKTSPISCLIQPTTLVAGRVNNLTITISNVAKSPIRSLSASFAFSGSQLTWLQPDIFRAETLNPMENATFQARIYNPPLSSASNTLQISLRYYDVNNVLNQETRGIGLLSKGMIDLRMTDSTVIPETPTSGQAFSITVTLTNMGSITASAVSVSPQLPLGFRTFGSKSVFIGDMQVNTPSTFTLSIFSANTTKAGVYVIPLEFSYFDNLRNPLLTTIKLSMEMANRTNAEQTTQRLSGGSQLGAFGVLSTAVTAAVALGIGFLIGKRHKRQ